MNKLKLTEIVKTLREDAAADKAAADARKIALDKQIIALQKRKSETNLSEDEVNEMARTPVKYTKGSVSPEEAGFTRAALVKANKILAYIDEKGEPQQTKVIANDVFGGRQQLINDLIYSMVSHNVLKSDESTQQTFDKKQSTYYGPDSTFKRAKTRVPGEDDDGEDIPTGKSLSKTTDAEDFFVGGNFDDEDMISGGEDEIEPDDSEIEKSTTNVSLNSAKKQASEFFLDDSVERLLQKLIANYSSSKTRIKENTSVGGDLSSSDFNKAEKNRKDASVSVLDTLIGQMAAKINSIADPEVRKEILNMLSFKLGSVGGQAGYNKLYQRIAREVGATEIVPNNTPSIPSIEDDEDDIDQPMMERFQKLAKIK